MPTKKQLTVGMKLKVTKENPWVKIGSIVEVHTINGIPAGRNTACATGEIYVLMNTSDQKCAYSGFKHSDHIKGYYIYLKHLSEIPLVEKKTPEDPHRELKIAFAHGAEIEYFDPHSGKWVSASTPYFHPKRKYRIKPEETAEPKFKERDLCMFVGTSWSIPKNTIVKYLRPYGDSYAIVESIESKSGFPRGMWITVDLKDLKPSPPVANPCLEVEMPVVQFCSAQPNPQQEETPMKFENKFFLNGRDITEFNDMQIFSIIKDAEDAIEKLEQITTKPKSLQKNIADRKAELAKLVGFLDAREPKAEA